MKRSGGVTFLIVECSLVLRLVAPLAYIENAPRNFGNSIVIAAELDDKGHFDEIQSAIAVASLQLQHDGKGVAERREPCERIRFKR
jgi:hypothetical protein